MDTRGINRYGSEFSTRGESVASVFNAVNHICLVVKNREASERFYVDGLGLKRHERIPSWFYLTRSTTLHLVEISEAASDASAYRTVQHFALEVSDLRAVLKMTLFNHLSPFQMDIRRSAKRIVSADDPLNFGTGTLFVYDPDGNLIEFIQLGKGSFFGG